MTIRSFDEKSAKRIGRVVRKVEHQRIGERARPSRRQMLSSQSRKICKIGWNSYIHASSTNSTSGWPNKDFANPDTLTARADLTQCKGNLSGVGVELTSPSTPGAACYKFTRSGIYALHTLLSAKMQPNRDGWPEFETTGTTSSTLQELKTLQTSVSTSTGLPGHSHTYRRFRGVPRGVVVSVDWTQTNTGSTENWDGIATLTRDVFSWDNYSGDDDQPQTIIHDVSSGHEFSIKFRTARATPFSGSPSAEIGLQVRIFLFKLWIEYIGPRLQPSTNYSTSTSTST